MTIQQNSRDITPIQNKTIDHSKLPKINISNINLKSQEHQNFNFQLKNQINESEDIKTPHIVAKIQNLKARNNSIDPDSNNICTFLINLIILNFPHSVSI